MIQHDKVLILDFGSQYAQIITRRVRDCGVFSEMHAGDWPLEKIKEFAPKAIIFSGGPNSVTADDTIRVDPAIYDLGIPILGICYGMQMMARAPATKKTKPTRNVNVAERSGKVEGLTNLAPLKVYLTGAALLWAIIGSIAQ